jgi:hypothetical protein
MGWWEQKSRKWKMVIVAQMGGGVGVGAGVFFLVFKSPDLPVKPVFVAIAGGLGVGGSIGSGVSIPWSDVVRQLINPSFRQPEDAEFATLTGEFSCAEIQRESISFGQIQGSVIMVGAQVSQVMCWEINMLGPNRQLFETEMRIPRNLPEWGRAALDLPQIQGGLGVGAFAFTGSLFYMGAS